MQIHGIKQVEDGTRIFELVELAGGALDDADLSRVNLSSKLKDEQKITIPFKIIEEKNVQKTSSNKVNSNISTNNNSQTTININYASMTELTKLNGIGEAMAQKIINYRNEVGYFNSIEEIKNVSGIGEAKFNKIKDDITV